MGLFDAKYCGVCGEKIKFLGNRKLEDADMCKKCAEKLSPFMTDRRKTTLEEIKEHLAYREANKAEVEKFNATSQYGENTKVLVDDAAGNFIVTSSSHWMSENPDIIPIAKVMGVISEVSEYKHEVKMKDKEGNEIAFDPPRYDIEYDFYVRISVNSRWFDEIRFKVNNNRIEANNPARYMEYDRKINEIREALLKK